MNELSVYYAVTVQRKKNSQWFFSPALGACELTLMDEIIAADVTAAPGETNKQS